VPTATEREVRLWHARGAGGLGIIAVVCFLATIVTDEIGVWAVLYFLASLVVIVALWLVLRSRSSRLLLLAWPVVDLLGMLGSSQVAPTAASLCLSAVLMAFLYVGFTQPRGTSVLLVPLAALPWWILVDLPTPQMLVRLVLVVLVWLTVAESSAWLLTNLSAARAEAGRLAITDPLTGLANRRAWDVELATRLGRREPFAVLLIDLDHFKDYNDRLGHLDGDVLLTHFGSALEAEIGDVASIARWGGEEFVAALPGMERAEAEAVAARVLRIVPARQTCSIGLTCREPDDTADSLMRRADRALYEAKAAGRARVSVC
jgi:diguanylate cyclase (GGDEF)-like protein